jgi:hypothetical protein
MITPMIPQMIAMMASTKPSIAPVAKLRTAAMIAMIEKMLKVALLVPGSFMRQDNAEPSREKAGVLRRRHAPPQRKWAPVLKAKRQSFQTGASLENGKEGRLFAAFFEKFEFAGPPTGEIEHDALLQIG